MAISFVSATSASIESSTSAPWVSRPAGVVEGDLIIAVLSAWDDYTITPPAGWTLVRRGALASSAVEVYVKTAGPSEPSSYTFTSSGSGYWSVGAAAYRGNRLTVDASAVAPVAASSSSVYDVVCPSITPTRQPSMLVSVALLRRGSNFTPPSGMAERFDRMNQNYLGLTLADQALASTGATGTRTFVLTTGAYNAERIGLSFNLYEQNSPPNAPILTAPADGAGIDRDSTQRFDWDFSDPDGGDSQSKHVLRYRVVGAASWTDVSGTTPNTFWDAPAGTFAAGDYEWQVRTYDAQGVVGPYSSSSFFTAGDAPPGPIITSPTNGGTFNQNQTVEWSTPAQDSYQIQVRDTGDVVLYDTGEVTSETTRAAAVPFPDNGTTRKLRLRVLDGGLWSPWYEITGTVSWLAPPEPVVSLLADNTSGSLAIAITNPAPTGEEPATVYNDVEINDGDGWVRVATMVAINGIYTYWLPRAGRDYGGNVRVTAVAENGVTAATTTTSTTEPPVEGFYGGY